MPSSPPPPTPSHLLRTHSAPLNALWFSDDNERLYSGDSQGSVIITSTRTLRPLASWKAHEDSILGVQEWDKHILTHGRDNKLHVWKVLDDSATKVRDAASESGLPLPELEYSMDVNALNYCRFSLLPCVGATGTGEDTRALLAVPNLVESALADVWTLPTRSRLHAAIGKSIHATRTTDGGGINAVGIIMSMHLFEYAHPNVPDNPQLRLLCSYENGSVTLWAHARKDKSTTIEGIGWDALWTAKLHVESVMAMVVSRDNLLALTVSADHLLGRYDLVHASLDTLQTSCTVHRTKHPGNAAVALRDDGRVCAVAGWDGKIRLYSTKSMKPLGNLDYHKKSCQAMAFARSQTDSRDVEEEEDSEDEMSSREKSERRRWLAAGSQDGRISVWPLITFGKP